jgi:hypothetical protein
MTKGYVRLLVSIAVLSGVAALGVANLYEASSAACSYGCITYIDVGQRNKHGTPIVTRSITPCAYLGYGLCIYGTLVNEHTPEPVCVYYSGLSCCPTAPFGYLTPFHCVTGCSILSMQDKAICCKCGVPFGPGS